MRDKNQIIEELICIIISLRQEKDKELCCQPAVYPDELCIHNCEVCKNDYYQKMKIDMMRQYSIK